MSPQLVFCITLLVLFLLVIYLSGKKYEMLRDISKSPEKPYSLSRAQLAWWSVIIISSFISILFSFNMAPTLTESALILLGISASTTAVGRIIDKADQAKGIPLSQDEKSQGFLIDILSDEKGVSIYRLQTVLFNLAFGIWYICTVFYYMKNFTGTNVDSIMPIISNNNLVLLGVSSATYVVLKTKEN
jgi:hypothetical protein